MGRNRKKPGDVRESITIRLERKYIDMLEKEGNIRQSIRRIILEYIKEHEGK